MLPAVFQSAALTCRYLPGHGPHAQPRGALCPVTMEDEPNWDCKRDLSCKGALKYYSSTANSAAELPQPNHSLGVDAAKKHWRQQPGRERPPAQLLQGRLSPSPSFQSSSSCQYRHMGELSMQPAVIATQ